MNRYSSLMAAAIGISFVSACSTTASVGPSATSPTVSIRSPLPAIHPLIGTWRIDLNNVNCYEIYQVRPDGTSTVTSGEEVSENEFDIALLPSSAGYYKWVDKIVKDNGKPDCMGSITPVGDVATNYILLHPSGKKFLMCQEENTNSCIGPFIRQ